MIGTLVLGPAKTLALPWLENKEIALVAHLSRVSLKTIKNGHGLTQTGCGRKIFTCNYVTEPSFTKF